jgi:EmrB/QacA subfamily drug resistance transporter
MDVATDRSDALDRGTILALVAMALAVFLIANDFTALSVALPNIEREFDSDVSSVQWVINGYALVFGVFIVTGGRLADMFGRRRLFFVGAGIFAAFSALAAVAPSLGMLVAARALMGVGGAIMWPAVLGMTFAALPERKAGLAGGLVLGVAGLGNAFGPLLGGFLTDALSWRWVFVVNLPVAALAAFVTWRHIHQPTERDADARIDGWGVATLTVALVALLVALDEVTDLGWGDPLIVALLAVFVVAMAAFVAVERRMGTNALVPRDVMRNPDFTFACLAVLFTAATFFASLLYLPQFFQKLLGYSPLEAGLALLPLMATFALVSFVAGSLYERVGAKPILSVGVSLMFLGILLLSFIGEDSGFAATLPGMAILGCGFGLFISTITTAAVTSLAAARSSLGGAILYMFQVAGGSVGLALTTTIFTRAAQDRLYSDAAARGVAAGTEELDDVQGVLAGTDSAARVLEQLPGRGAQITELVRDAFVDGMTTAFRVDAALALVGVIVTVLCVGGRVRLGRARPVPRAAPAPGPGTEAPIRGRRSPGRRRSPR